MNSAVSVAESVAAIVLAPADFRVAVNVPAPLVRGLSAGSDAAPSVLEKCTVPAYAGVRGWDNARDEVERKISREWAVVPRSLHVPAMFATGAKRTLSAPAKRGRVHRRIPQPHQLVIQQGQRD